MFSNDDKQLKTATTEWLQNSFQTTHIGTLHLLRGFRSLHGAEQVAERFNHKLHSILHGATKWDTGKAHLQLPILFVLHAHEAYDGRPHLHIAFGGMNDLMPLKELQKIFYQAAKNTRGVQFRWKPNELWYATRGQHGDVLNNSGYTMKYRNLNGSERLERREKSRLSVHFDECKDSREYLHYICRRVQQGSSLDTVLIQHMHNA